MEYLKTKIINILENDSRTTIEEISQMLTIDVNEIQGLINELKEENIILKYTTIINREKISDNVMALIEVKVTPQKGSGFGALSQKISKYSQVETLYLISGDYDFLVVIQEKNMKKVAEFVHEKLAGIDGVVSTATHFVLKTYKQAGVVFEDEEKDHRLVVSP